MGGFLKDRQLKPKLLLKWFLTNMAKLADNRDKPAGVFLVGKSFTRNFACLVMQPQVLVDEPSVAGLAFHRYGVGMLDDLQKKMVKLLSWWNKMPRRAYAADIGYVLHR